MNPTTSTDLPPLIALAMGDPCGISPELTARLLVDEEIATAARLLVIVMPVYWQWVPATPASN